MVRTVRVREVLGVAGEAIGRGACVDVVDVTLGAGNVKVHSSQGIVCKQGVIEGSIQPIDGGVATAAVVWQAELQVIWVLSRDKLSGVACVAGRRCCFELVIDVTGRTCQCGMHTSECEACELEVIEDCVVPTIH